ncbi:HNH endonuclease [Paenibacillus alkaliterrae]|nr:HNH endonuclease [Paenibacillus alkaliterrae]
MTPIRSGMLMDETNRLMKKPCLICKENKPLSAFLRRTGKRSSAGSRRGTCRDCRKAKAATAGIADKPPAATLTERVRKAPVLHVPARSEQQPPLPPLQPSIIQAANDAALLRTTRQGTVWMRGRTDKGRRWYQEIELELAVTLVKERAAVLVNRYTIRRLYSNKDFRQYILDRDNHMCYFCGGMGDTIDHMLPRAKGGHTTPDNCVCACNACNQSKADKDIVTFMNNEEVDL